MRRFIRVIAILSIAAGLGGLSGCKKKEKDKEAAKSGEGGAGAGIAKAGDPDQPAAGRYQAQGLSRIGMQPVTVEEVKPLIPELAGATPLAEPTSVAGGRRVTVMKCLPAEDMEKVKAEVQDQLTKLGFSSIRTSPQGKRDLVTISAEKPPMRVAATLRSGPYPDCPADQKKIKLLMSYFKRLQRPPRQGGAAPDGTAPAGTPPAAGAAGTAPAPPTPSGSTGGAAQ
jgi:hypothetical protein